MLKNVLLIKIKKIEISEAYDLFIGKKFFKNDGSQNFLIFQPVFNTFTVADGITKTIVAWKFKKLPNGKLRILLQQMIVFLQN